MNPADAAALCHGCMESSPEPRCPHCGWMRGDWCQEYPLALRPGTLLGNRYVVGKVLGQGGFGITYIGWDLVLSRKKAIKECFPQGIAGRQNGDTQVFATSPSAREALQHDVQAFLAEARTLARFENHPNIVWIQDFFPANGTAYMIIEYLHGKTLEQHVKDRGGRIPWEEAGRILMPVLDALREVHRVGILHRDVSPDNVYLLRSGHVKLIDFGAARATAGAPGGLSVILKHGFGPMEQYQSTGNQGPWTDVYAAAGTAYRAITGKVPPAAPERYANDLLQPPSALGVAMPPAHEQALLQALAVRVEQRFPDVTSFQRALLESTPPPLPVQRSTPAPPPPAVPAPDPLPLPNLTPLLNTTPLPKPVPSPGPKVPWLWIGLGLGIVVVGSLVALAAYRVWKGNPPEIASFSVNPTTVASGRPATLSWSVTGAKEVQVEGVGPQQPSGSVEVKPTETRIYRLIATAPDGSTSTKEVQVATRAPVVPKILAFGVTPGEADEGSQVVLAWKTEDAERVAINGTDVKIEDEIPFVAAQSRNFQLQATSSDGETVSRDSSLIVRPKFQSNGGMSPSNSLPVIREFRFNRTTVRAGEAATLNWVVEGATDVRLSGLQKTTTVNPRGSLNVTFAATATIGIRATNAVGAVTKDATVEVIPAGVIPPAAGLQIRMFRAAPNVVYPGTNVRLEWQAPGATYVIVGGVDQRFAADGSITVKPVSTTDYRLNAYNAQGRSVSASVTVEVRQGNAYSPGQPSRSWPVIHDLNAGIALGGRGGKFQRGTLTLQNGRLRFDAQNQADNFDVAMSEIKHFGKNMLSVQGMPGFHVTLWSGRNYNFAPTNHGVSDIVSAVAGGQ